MTRVRIVSATAAALLLALSGVALAQGVGGTPPSTNPGGTTLTPRSDPSGASSGLPSQSDQGVGSPTRLGTGTAPTALTLPDVDKMTPAQIQARLQSNGFQNVRNLSKDKTGGYSATAMKDGQPVKLQIEASSGRVTTTND